MAYSYVPRDRDQLFLLPTGMREWLPGPAAGVGSLGTSQVRISWNVYRQLTDRAKAEGTTLSALVHRMLERSTTR
jgi:hypothetical protein